MSVDVEEVAVPGLVGRLDLDRVDYEDAFTVAVARPRKPEQLMRDMLEGAPPWFLHAWSSLLAGHFWACVKGWISAAARTTSWVGR